MKYNLYTIYDNDLRECSDIFLSANDDTANRVFEEHKRKIKANNPAVELEYLKLVNIGEYDTKINVQYDSSVQMIVDIDPLINPEKPYFVGNPPMEKPKRLKEFEADKHKNIFFEKLVKENGGKR